MPRLFYAGLLFASLASCAPRSVYIPLSHNVPLFDSVRKMQGTVYVSSNHMEIQMAGNPLKHLAAAVNVNFGSGIAVYDAALGWYGYDHQARWRYEVMAGIGYNSNLYLRDPNDKALFNKSRNGFDVVGLYNRYYLQPALGFEDDFGYYNIRYGFSLAVRTSYLFFQRYQYREIDADKTIDPDHPVYVVNKTYKGKDMWVFEPALIHTVKRGPFAVTVQLQATSPYSRNIDVSDTKFSPGLLVSTGFRYTLNRGRRAK